MMAQQRYNFNMKVMVGNHVLFEQRISVSQENAAEIFTARIMPNADRDKGIPSAEWEERINRYMYDIERAINSEPRMYLRCHIEQLPSDIPAGVTLDEENQKLIA